MRVLERRSDERMRMRELYERMRTRRGRKMRPANDAKRGIFWEGGMRFLLLLMVHRAISSTMRMRRTMMKGASQDVD